ncbi:MAG: hypothetical protein Q8K96_14025 [Rubrivivax sp.]|nr:hypothetical protein [Rubrivivax sp.]
MHRQLDIFDDSRDVALRNDLAQALLDGDQVTARSIANTLQAEFGADPVLAPAAALIEHHHWRQSLDANGHLDVATVLDARHRLDGPVAPAAIAVFGAHAAPAWLAGQWRWLAGQASAIGWHPAHAEAHAAALYLRGQAWPQAAEAVARIDSWRRIPVPLLWMTQARWRGDGADAAWPLLAEALWLAPARAAALLPALADTHLDRLVARFEERFDPTAASGADWAWLPAFALVDQPLLAGPLSPATPSTETASGEGFTVVMALLRLERQGRHHEIVAHRARLRTLSATLFAAYMATR